MRTTNPSARPDSGFLGQFAAVNGSLIAFICVSSLFHLQAQVFLHAIVGSLLVLIALAWPSLVWRAPTVLQTWGGAGVLLFACLDFVLNGSNLLPPMLRLVVHLLLLRVWQRRRPREDMQLLLLCLVVILISGALSLSLGFALHLVAFCPLVMAQLVAITLRNSLLTSNFPEHLPHSFSWADFFARLSASLDWRVLPLAGLVFAITASVSFLVFTLLPRVNIENTFSFLRLPAVSLSGFTDEVKFGSVTNIMESDAEAFVADFSEGKPPADPYWRMIVMDRYAYPDKAAASLMQGTFRMSDTARTPAPREQNPWNLGLKHPLYAKPPANSWKIFMKSGISRFLPFPGFANSVAFSQNFRFESHDKVGVLALENAPSSMVGLQYVGVASMDRIHWSDADKKILSRRPEGNLSVFTPSPVNPARLNETDNRYPFSTLEHPGDEASLALLDAALAAIAARPELAGAGKDIPATLWAQAAVAHLREKHQYSLSSTIPDGPGDVLCRWLASDSPGHCELYSGAFTLLARRAGYPCRLIGGYQGGIWVESQAYCSVRNRHAHAWCEILGLNPDNRRITEDRDSRDYLWFRVDPTGGRVAGDSSDTAQAAGSMETSTASTIGSRLDDLRVMWYRYIVDFDNVSRKSVAASAKERWSQLSESLQTWFKTRWEQFVAWLREPWDFSRISSLGLAALALIASIPLLRLWRRGWRPPFWPKTDSRRDPVRRHAGQLLARLRELPPDPDRDQLLAAMLELRFGDGSLAPQAQQLFAKVRQHLRQTRRQPRPTPAAAAASHG